ncbi:MAG: ubiquinol-cytochrome C chaperone family protein [Beijerinckiaceae bacterium]|nr:ubiquinol-cytochrome C chaperone family protein [Beijerinckiaceae bacterium]
MFFGLFRRSANRVVIERLYTVLVAASRQPALFTGLGMADTFEGRFESLTLHAALVLRALNALPAPGPDLAQDLVDAIFRHFDHTLREMGVGDTAVPKRMKTLAGAFLGRSAAYDEALREGPEHLAPALSRNILHAAKDDSGAANAALIALTAYAGAVAAGLKNLSVQNFIDGAVPFPDPATFMPKELAS